MPIMSFASVGTPTQQLFIQIEESACCVPSTKVLDRCEVSDLRGKKHLSVTNVTDVTDVTDVSGVKIGVKVKKINERGRCFDVSC